MKKKIAIILFGLILGLIIVLSVMSAETTGTLTAIYRKNFWHGLVYPEIYINHKLITVRQAAHMYEYFLLGLVIGFFTIKKKKMIVTSMIAFLSCIVISNVDQLSKLIVPGREYDPMDLLFDAMGYTVALILVIAIQIACNIIGNKQKGNIRDK